MRPKILVIRDSVSERRPINPYGFGSSLQSVHLTIQVLLKRLHMQEVSILLLKFILVFQNEQTIGGSLSPRIPFEFGNN